MAGLSELFDPYDRRARLYPMVLVLLPLAVGVAVWMPADLKLGGVLGSAVVAVGLASFLTQVARDQGKAKERRLFELWGGRPSDRIMSYAAGACAPETVRRRHLALRRMDPAMVLPASSQEEQADPERFRTGYAAATEYLLSQTRDRSKFRLLFEENMNYGYRRNLWGMKPAGLATAVIGVVACAAQLGYTARGELPLSPITVLSGAGCVLLVVLWVLRVTPAWVRIAADAYARQLFESCDRLVEASSAHDRQAAATGS